MRRKLVVALLIVLCLIGQNLAAECTIFAVGKDASADGSTMVSHTCDSTSDDFTVYIIPSMKGGADAERDIVLNSHAHADYSNYPEVKDYGAGMLVDTMAQSKDTNQYLHSMYSFMNDKGLAVGESTFWYSSSTEQGKKLDKAIYENNNGIIDAYSLQDFALENCSKAREAILYMGDILKKYGWNTSVEIFNICDGDEAWVMEIYGRDLWAAVRVPDNAVFVGANRARINYVDMNDTENYLCSDNLVSFAVENGLWSEASGVPFRPCEVYSPYPQAYSSRREWRAMTLLDPTLDIDPEDTGCCSYPLFVVPQNKVSVQDIYDLCSDYYSGTDYDVTKTVEAGPFGNPLNVRNAERTINLFRCTYIQIANVKSWLPDEAKCLVWFGWGAPDSTYLVPLWGSQTRLPKFFSEGTRLSDFDPNSGWWVCSYVQQVATINYQDAIKTIHGLRDPKMEKQYNTVNVLQNQAALMIKNGLADEAVDLLTTYSYQNASQWHDQWYKLGNELLSTYMFGMKDMGSVKVSDWWKNVVATAAI
ncbi:MAG: C69 family dipeptidase [Candidatus Cloacimonetes bacterium]|nr:C69 family dipeptidase [Candidatus Cloacimonadota bacterium]